MLQFNADWNQKNNTVYYMAHCGGEGSEYGNPAIWLVHKWSDIFHITRSGDV